MRPEHESLQPSGSQDPSLQGVQVQCFQPAEHRRPVAPAGAGFPLRRQMGPMCGRSRVMLEVITIIEEESVVEPAIMAGRASGMFVMALQVAQAKAYQETRQVSGAEEFRGADRQCQP